MSHRIRVALLALATACGAPSSQVDAGPACTFIDPRCESPTPSYATVVQPIVLQSCAPCHHPKSSEARTSLTSYDDIDGELTSVLTQVSSCLMPPAGSPQPTAAERAALLTWLACGAPEN